MARLPSPEPGCGCVVLDAEGTREQMKARIERALADFFKRKRGAPRAIEVLERHSDGRVLRRHPDEGQR